MSIKKIILLLLSYTLTLAIGFAAGIYMLPILTAPAAPTDEQVRTDMGQIQFEGSFRRDLKGSDIFHWGEGSVYVNRSKISLIGKIAPGPDYKLYLSPEFVETKARFLELKSGMVQVGDVKTFNNFVVPVSGEIDPALYNTVIVWCESFSQFITSAQYK